jgi:uncharacterized protein YkwD
MRRVKRRAIFAGAAAVAVTVGLIFGGRYFSSEIGADDERSMQASINDARVDRGLRRLEIRSFLRDYAERQAASMADAGRIFHDPCLGCGEVIGVVAASNVARIFRAWMLSDGHRAVLMDPDATRLGCGVVHRSGFDWWACEIRY